MRRMIYHAAYEFNYESVSASAIRPIKMFEAFKHAGYEVFDLTGEGVARRRKFKRLRELIENGVKFDFMYSESATIPAMLGDASHFPHLFLDAQIFRFLNKRGVPTSVFYRDLYWAYDEYLERVKRPLADGMRMLYRYELALYRRYADTIFVPSDAMAREIPQLRIPKVRELPPGGEILDVQANSQKLSLFYVGGIGVHYRLHELVNAVAKLPDVNLTICTARERWEQVKHEYRISSPNINVVHARGEELNKYYRQSNVCVIVVDPSHYWSFAVPVKLFEYVGRGKPIIATKGTLASRIVADNGWGWTVDNEPSALIKLLKNLESDPGEVLERTRKVQADRENHSWLARANQVKSVLVGE